MRKAAPASTATLRARCASIARAMLAGALCITLAGGCLPIGIRGSNLPSFAGTGAASTPAHSRDAATVSEVDRGERFSG